MEVGHNIYILAYQLAQHKKELKHFWMETRHGDNAIQYYAQHTAQIEVCLSGTVFISDCIR